jgi:hypothetical protein
MTPTGTHRPPRWAPTLAAAALVLLAGTACTAAAAPLPTPAPSTYTTPPRSSSGPPPSTTAPTRPTTRTTTRPPSTTRTSAAVPSVRGRVVDGRTGAPMAGVIVEFKNLSGGNAHTRTAADGTYALRLPEDVYTALAMTEDPDSDLGFDVVGGDNSVSVPPSTRVDFESHVIG